MITVTTETQEGIEYYVTPASETSKPLTNEISHQ